MKFGLDGSGSHSNYNQINNAHDPGQLFCPLSVENADGTKIWDQKYLNALYSQWPVALQMGIVLWKLYKL